MASTLRARLVGKNQGPDRLPTPGISSLLRPAGAAEWHVPMRWKTGYHTRKFGGCYHP